MMCPAGCGHPVDQHGETAVSFNRELKGYAGEQDYEAITCHTMTGELGKPAQCRCCVRVDEWDRLLLEDAGQGRLF